MRQHLPNAITLVNLVCGVWAIIAVFQGEVWLVLGLLGVGLLADLLDGAVARALGATSALGRQLDSLADLISFGVVPGLIWMLLIQESQGQAFPPEAAGWWMIGTLVPVLSAIRLGRFNLEEAQPYFTGVPTPANAIWVLALWTAKALSVSWWVDSLWVMIGLAILSASWLVWPMRLLALKWVAGGWRANSWGLGLLLGGALILIIGKLEAAPLVFLWYLMLSLVKHYAFHQPKP